MGKGNSQTRTVGCIECGGEFPSSRGQRLCSTPCRQSRYARRVAAAFPRPARLAIFERDGWICGICHRSVDPTLKRPDLMSASVDHVIPVTRGGAHTPANAQCSHWLCNMRKHNRIAPHAYA